MAPSEGSGLILVDVYVVDVAFPSFWGGRLSLSIFSGFCGACPAGLGFLLFLFWVDAHVLDLGEVLSVFRLFWGPLASCSVIGYLLGFALFGINSYLSKKKC